jgi:hypothetical protein
MRRTPDMHPHGLFPSPTSIVSLPPRRPSVSSQARRNSPKHTPVLSAPLLLAQRAAPGSEEGPCGRLQRKIAAHTQREDTPQWAPAAIAGTGARVGYSSNAISADFSDTVLCAHLHNVFHTSPLLLSLDAVLSHSSSSAYLLCSLL